MKMRSVARNATILAAMGIILWGCAGTPPSPVAPTVSARPASSAEVLRDHQRRQAIRAREGGYERLYRPRVCRSNVGPCAR
ncbi:hypothetical protein ASG39_12920 [Rhizobium sp. Leaf371]|uniref:hypothetical protein n=1 Tax=Rhizobium sp. Leaf371 TaxID=1736355 RepID=UPI000716069F|nr:hypothetical protein [Rhizobium sp. Leaf371]KQS64081.1 hypothetical protein ASG39_12920 [Rhizobium sp. Leaf371]